MRGCVLHNPASYMKENHDTNTQPWSVLLLCSRALMKTIARQTGVVMV